MTTKTTDKKRDNWFNSYNIQVFTPDGTLYVCITEGHDNEPFMIFITGPKNQQPLQIWIAALTQLINEMWKAGIHTSTIIRSLDTPYTSKYSQNDNGIRIYSGPDGIRWALTQYLQLRSHDRRREAFVGSRVG